MKADPPRRAMSTGRNGEAALTTPIAIESQRMIHALWIVSEPDGRPGRSRGQRDRRVRAGAAGRRKRAHDRGSVSALEWEGSVAAGATRRHETGEVDGEIGGDRRGDRGDDRILGRAAGRRDARDGLPRPAAAGPDRARAGAAARPAARRRLLVDRGARLAGRPVHRGRRRRAIRRRALPPDLQRLTPCERVADAAIQPDPFGWILRRLADLPAMLTEAGSRGPHRRARRRRCVRQAMPAILATIEATLAYRPGDQRRRGLTHGAPFQPRDPRHNTRRVSVRVVPGVNPDCQQSAPTR